MCNLYYTILTVRDNNKYTNFEKNISTTTNISLDSEYVNNIIKR